MATIEISTLLAPLHLSPTQSKNKWQKPFLFDDEKKKKKKKWKIKLNIPVFTCKLSGSVKYVTLPVPFTHEMLFVYLLGTYHYTLLHVIQYNLNGSNTDDSFAVDDSNSFFSPYTILPIAQENKYLGIFSYLIRKLYVVCTH